MNRAQITCGDIPRFNYGHAVGNFANISSINITYATGGITTTYTLAAVGAGRKTKDNREKQQIIRRLRNVEENVKDAREWLTRDQFEELLGNKGN